MEFRLVPTAAPGDPFGRDTPFNRSTTAATEPDSFTLAAADSWLPPELSPPADPGDMFSALDTRNRVPAAVRSEKFVLVSAAREDDFFAGWGGHSTPSTSSRFEKFTLVSLERPDYVGIGTQLGLPVEPEATFTKGATDFHKFTQFTKVQETDDGNIEVWGVATHEQPDLDGESCDYETAKRAYQDWSTAAVSRTSAAGQQISLGPIRYQHSTEPAGKATKIQYDDDGKAIWLGSVPINDDIRKQLQDGYLTGYSQGGSYAWRRCADCGKNLTLQQANNYCPDCKKKVPVTFGLGRLSEVSYVDSPCTGKGFSYVKQDGSSQFVSFAKRATPGMDDVRILETEHVFRDIWKYVVEIAGRKLTVIRGQHNLVII